MTKEEIAFEIERAEWRALDRVLNYINTLEDAVVKKSVIYGAVMDMRPSSFRREPNKAAS